MTPLAQRLVQDLYMNKWSCNPMEIFTLLTLQGCMQGGNNLVNTMELQHFPSCYKVVNTLYHF